MKHLIGSNHTGLNNHPGQLTQNEITRQPTTWKNVYKKLKNEKNLFTSFLRPIAHETKLQIVLTGAGSSAYIGDMTADTWARNLDSPAKAVPTTDLLTHFNQHIDITRPLLLVSFPDLETVLKAKLLLILQTVNALIHPTSLSLAIQKGHWPI